MKRIFTFVIVLAILASTFTFGLATVSAVTGDSENLILENPSFNEGSTRPFGVSGSAVLELCEEDSQDGDDYCCRVTSRGQKQWDSTTYNPQDIYTQQTIETGEMKGDYVFSCWVKVGAKGKTAKIRAAIQIDFEKDPNANRIGKQSKEYSVTSDEWTKIEVEYSVDFTDKPKMSNAKLYFTQTDLTPGSKAPDILVDNYCLIKKGTYVKVTPEPDVEIPSPKKVADVVRSDKTQIGAVYFNAYYATTDEWNNVDRKWYTEAQDPAQTLADSEYWTLTGSSNQCARALSPAQFHHQAPYFSICDKKTGKITFPEFTQERWKDEMKYAIQGKLDYFAYLISNDEPTLNGIKYHTADTEINSKLHFTAIIQSWFGLNTEARNVFFDALKSDAWLKVDGMRVVYIYDATKNADQATVLRIRKMAVLNGISDPLYFIGMGYTNANSALAGAGVGMNAASFYSVGASAEAESYQTLAQRNIEYLEKILNASKIIPTGAMATLGRNTEPRIVNPVSWTKPTATKLAYSGWYVKDGTNEEIGKHVLDVLNWNKKNADKTQPNLMIMYSWNEFDEGGWLCPTLLCDEKGNVQYNDDGTAKADTGHLDAVKKAIEAFRKYEEHPSVIVDYEGNIVEGSLNDVEQTATPATEVTPSASADTQTPAKKNNSWIIWVCLGAIVVIGATVAVVVTLKKKSAGKTDENEQAAEESNQDGKE